MPPYPKNVLRDPIMGLFNLTKLQTEPIILTPAKVDLTKEVARCYVLELGPTPIILPRFFKD